jgi:hypothetical protein
VFILHDCSTQAHERAFAAGFYLFIKEEWNMQGFEHNEGAQLQR